MMLLPVIFVARLPSATAPAISVSTAATLWAAHNSSRSLPAACPDTFYRGLLQGSLSYFEIPCSLFDIPLVIPSLTRNPLLLIIFPGANIGLARPELVEGPAIRVSEGIPNVASNSKRTLLWRNER
jgi:hypothetical protein